MKYLNGLQKYLSSRANYWVVMVLLLMGVVSGLVYTLGSRRVANQLLTIYEQRHMNLVKSGSSSLESFLEISKSALVNLSMQVGQNDGEMEMIFADFIENWKGTPITRIAYINAEGKFVLDVTRQEVITRDDVDNSDREYYRWSTTARSGEVYLGTPLKPRIAENQPFVIPMATPLYIEGKYAGVLVVGVDVERVANNYLESLKVGDYDDVFLISSGSVVIYSSYPEVIGLNLINELKEKVPFIGADYLASLSQEIISGKKEGHFDALLPDKDGLGLRQVLVSHTPVVLNGQHMMLATVGDKEKILELVAPFYVNEIGVLIVGFMILFALGVIVVKGRAYKQGLKDAGRL